MSTDASKIATRKYWDRRMNRDPAAQTVDDVIAELNRQLFTDPAYRPGTRFILKRTEGGVETATWEGPAQARTLIHRVLAATRHVTLPVPFQMDGVKTPDVDSPRR